MKTWNPRFSQVPVSRKISHVSFVSRRYDIIFRVCVIAWMFMGAGCVPEKKRIEPDVRPLKDAMGYANGVVRRIVALAKQLETQRLIYSANPQKNRDCSGIFHRLLDRLENEFPNIQRPPIQTCRSSRAIAAWYERKGGLIIVDDPLAKARYIRPGTIMFYGGRKERYFALDLETVLAEIEHIGIVTRVNPDAFEQIHSYELFHGRSRFKPAAITRYHTRIPTRSVYPPLGNGDQQWIAYSNVLAGSAANVREKNGDPHLFVMNEYAADRSKFVQTGMAAWYGDRFNGKATASGELFDSSELTGAHRTLPFGTRVKVTDLETGASVVIRINDRGPYSKKRIIDLSRAAAEKIGLIEKGTAKVRIETK